MDISCKIVRIIEGKISWKEIIEYRKILRDREYKRRQDRFQTN